MPEATVKLSIEVPKAFIQQALDRKPKWLSATDEGYLGKMFAAGNFDEFFKNYEGINDKLSEVQRVYLEAVKEISQRVGSPIVAPPIIQPVRKKRSKAGTKATEAPAGSERSTPA